MAPGAEWIAAVWNKINKPLHYLLVGLAFILFAPNNWYWVGYIFVAMALAGSLEWTWAYIRLKRLNMLQSKLSHENALKSIEALTEPELQTLYLFLSSGGTRFTVQAFTPAEDMMRKGVLKPVKYLGRGDYLCDIHPSILKQKEKIVADLAKLFPDHWINDAR